MISYTTALHGRGTISNSLSLEFIFRKITISNKCYDLSIQVGLLSRVVTPLLMLGALRTSHIMGRGERYSVELANLYKASACWFSDRGM